MGRGDVRRGAALPRRGPVGAARRAARGHAEPCLQMLLRGRNTVGYTPYPVEVTDGLRRGGRAHRHRRLPGVRRAQRRRADAPGDRGGARHRHRRRGGRPLLHQRPARPGERLYTLDYYLRLAERIVDAGAHVLAIKDMAGLLRAPAARTSSPPCASGSTCRCTCTPTTPPAASSPRLLAAIDAGVDAVDVASASMAGTTSQVPMSALVAATDHTERETGLDLRAVCDLEPYWEAVRRLYAPFESGLPSPTGRVYDHEIPGGQLSNLRQQAIALGLGEKFEAIEDTYAAANRMLGNIVKVTPSSKVVGDLALALVGRGVDPADFEADPGAYDIPDSVIGFLQGELGDPPGGWPEPFRSKALAGRSTSRSRVAELTDDDRAGLAEDRRATLNRLLFPGPTKDFTDLARHLQRPVGAAHGAVPARAAAGRGGRGRDRAGQAAAVRRAVDERGRRARHAHRDVHAQRPAAPDPHPRRERGRRRPGHREGRPRAGRPGRGSVRRRRVPGRRAGRAGRRGRHRRRRSRR